jgi:hypothetical protein
MKIPFEILFSLVKSVVVFFLIVYVGRGIIYVLDIVRGLDKDYIQTLFRDILIPGFIAPFWSVLVYENSENKIVIFLKILLFVGVMFALIHFNVIEISSTVFQNNIMYILIGMPLSCLFAFFKINSDLKTYGEIRID